MDERIRASDADRERVTARLRDHYAEGRLTSEELDERTSAALNAKTFGDLRRVMADLPDPLLVPQGARARRACSRPGGPGSRTAAARDSSRCCCWCCCSRCWPPAPAGGWSSRS